jgi:type II secretory pathway component GspD/PulD (secretin)
MWNLEAGGALGFGVFFAKERHMSRLTILALAAVLFGGVATWGQATATATKPAASVPATRALTETMSFKFENASIDTVLDEMSARLGFVIQRTVVVNGKISITAPQPVNADEAITLLNSLLVPLGYGAVEKPAQEQADGRMARVLRVLTLADAKKEAPVRGQ